MGEVYASFFFIFILMGMVIDKRCDSRLYEATLLTRRGDSCSHQHIIH